MYVILVWDIPDPPKPQLLIYLRRYLNHVQHSVVEGYLTVAQWDEVWYTVKGMLDDHDSVIAWVWTVGTPQRLTLGPATDASTFNFFE